MTKTSKYVRSLAILNSFYDIYDIAMAKSRYVILDGSSTRVVVPSAYWSKVDRPQIDPEKCVVPSAYWSKSNP